MHCDWLLLSVCLGCVLAGCYILTLRNSSFSKWKIEWKMDWKWSKKCWTVWTRLFPNFWYQFWVLKWDFQFRLPWYTGSLIVKRWKHKISRSRICPPWVPTCRGVGIWGRGPRCRLVCRGRGSLAGGRGCPRSACPARPAPPSHPSRLSVPFLWNTSSHQITDSLRTVNRYILEMMR